MKKRYKKYKSNISSRTTVMVIPNNSKKIIKFSIPHFISYTVIASFIFLLVGLSTSIFYVMNQQERVNRYNRQIQLQEDEISKLTKKNNQYLSELSLLQNKTKEINNELKALNNFKNAIYEKINKSTLPENTKEQPVSSIASSNSLILPQGGGENLDFNEIAHNLNKAVDSSNRQIKYELQSLQDLNSQVESLLPYLEAYPSMLPAQGRITSEMGWRKNPFNTLRDEFHSGMDIAADIGTDVMATGKGVVSFSGYKHGYGYLVIIDHDFGIETRYAHNSSLIAKLGEHVKRGDIIAKSGNTGNSTGPHIHYEIRLNGEPQDPRNYLIDYN